MRKFIFCLLSFSVAILGPLHANVIQGVAAIPDGYYSSVDSKKGADNILNALNTIISNHSVISYAGLEPYYELTDFYADTLWDMYSTCRFTMEDANGGQTAVCDAWNREHVCCQSWLGSGPMVSDLFNVYPTDARVNNFRSNYPYGEVDGPNGTGITNKGESRIAPHALGKLGANTFSGYTGKVFEPHDDYKGDFARTFMYMVARYRDNILNSSTEGKVMFTSGPTNFTDYAKNLLMKWHRADPVSQKEIDRNQAIYDSIQHNRNPFIDYPELAEYIWGNKVGQQVDLSTMTPTCEGGGYTPGTSTKYGVTWIVNGMAVGLDSIIGNRAITTLPATPTSCSESSDTFVGWTNTVIAGATDTKPAVLYTKVADFPVVSTDVAYYAVFAKATQGAAVEPAVYTYDENHTEGWTNTASVSGSYWLLDKGKLLTSPEIDLSGLSSIEVNMRTYGGTQYCNLDVKAGETQIATIVATNGKTLTDYKWTNDQYLSGRSALTFSTDYNTNQGIGFTSVTINATGAGTTYSAYLTSCGATDLDNFHSPTSNVKLIIDGHIYIQVGENIYTITGQKVQ